MMTFCHKNVHSFLGFPNTSRDNINGTVDVDVDYHADSLIFQRHQNSTMKSSPVLFSSPFSTSSDTMIKRDPGGIGFIDDVGGIVDGLMSCTESLGFESSDERRVDDQTIESLNYESMCNSGKESTVGGGGSKWKREHVKREVKKFPPPLSSLDQNGKPTFFLRPVRKDGKLELREVKISRPEILRASRQDGRLRLHLVCNEDEDEDDFEEQYEEEEEDEEIMQEIDEDDVQEKIERKMEQAIMEGCTEQDEEEKEEERIEGWQIPVSPGGGEAFRRCYEQVSHHQNHHHHHQHGQHHHHHDLHVWRQHCVTIS